MPVDTPLKSVPEAEQLDGSSSSEADDEDFNSEATESACSESAGSGADSDAAGEEAGGVAEQAANALPAQTAASADEYAGIWGVHNNSPHFVVCPSGVKLTLGTRTLWEQTLRTSRTSTHQCWTLPTLRRRCVLRLPHNSPLLLCNSTTAQENKEITVRTACGSPRRATTAMAKAKTTVAVRATRRAQAPRLLALPAPNHWALPSLRFQQTLRWPAVRAPRQPVSS